MVKLQQTKTGQYVITIPREYVRLKQWGKGTEVVIAVNEKGDLILKEVKA